MCSFERSKTLQEGGQNPFHDPSRSLVCEPHPFHDAEHAPIPSSRTSLISCSASLPTRNTSHVLISVTFAVRKKLPKRQHLRKLLSLELDRDLRGAVGGAAADFDAARTPPCRRLDVSYMRMWRNWESPLGECPGLSTEKPLKLFLKSGRVIQAAARSAPGRYGRVRNVRSELLPYCPSDLREDVFFCSLLNMVFLCYGQPPGRASKRLDACVSLASYCSCFGRLVFFFP